MSFCLFQSFLVRRLHMRFCRTIWSKEDGPTPPTPASRGCRGLQIQISSFSPAMHFRMKLERTKLRSFLCHRAPLFLCPKSLPGWNLVVVAVEGKQTKGPILLYPYSRQGRGYKRGIKWEDGKVCCRATLFT